MGYLKNSQLTFGLAIIQNTLLNQIIYKFLKSLRLIFFNQKTNCENIVVSLKNYLGRRESIYRKE